MNSQSQPQVTIVVVPRERFSCTQQSLESIYEHTQIPFKLIYIDGNSPTKIKNYLESQAQARNFQIIRTECYLYPNQARNIGLKHVDTKYLVFFDNDVIVTPGWLNNLVDCAEKTQAAVVGPLMCQYEPLHEIVHFAGGEAHIWQDKTGRRRLREKMYLQGKQVTAVKPQLKRTETELAEFHCVLVRKNVFDLIGGQLDEAFYNTKEHLDFCMSVREAGEKVYFEPDCIVTYLPGPPLDTSDVHFYMLRWSDAWQLNSLRRMREKWNLAEDAYFTTKYKRLCWRRYGTIIEPLAKRLTFGVGTDFVARAISTIDNKLNRILTNIHKRSQKKQLLIKD